MPRVIALIPTDLERSRLGLPSLAARPVGGKAVLRRVVERVARIESIERIVLVHPAGQDPAAVAGRVNKPVALLADPADLRDPYQAMRTAARKWAPHAWRGGPGGMTCYDELLPAAPLLAAMTEHNADAALLVGGDWPLVDPAWCRRMIDLHLEFPEAMQMTFTQAPPGLAGVMLSRKLLAQLAESPSATIGQMLAYVPSHPQADPIGRDVCVQIPAQVRSCARRFIYDTPRAAAMIDALAAKLGDAFDAADASLIAQTLECLERDEPARGFAPLPQQVTLELTARRAATGPIVPQHYVALDRPPMTLDAAVRVVRQMGACGDVALTLGGLGDALLHEHWDKVVEAAHASGVLGLCIETDLIVPRATLDRLIELPIDVIAVRLNADRAANYARVMGVDQFATVIGGLQHLFDLRGKRAQASGAGVPWIVPKMVKTAETLDDMESFFDKWVHYLGHAVIEPATSGCGLMPRQSPVSMAPPRRSACRQLSGRMTVHSDARVARCDQDWLGRGAAGDAAGAELAALWKEMEPVRTAHSAGRWNELELCSGCSEWHRP